MNFAEIVRSQPFLRKTFDGISGVNLWWRLVLFLHGKPVKEPSSSENKKKILAKGFRFYGWLYFSLGLLMLMGALSLAWLHPQGGDYWIGVTGLGAVYLIGCSRLAFHGARRFQSGDRKGAVLLIAFFFSILVFLAAFAGLFSLWLHQGQLISNPLNLIFLTCFLLFGIGSYMIEVIYLSWNPEKS